MFCRTKNKINFNYSINDVILPNVTTIHGLGITFQSDLLFSTHIDQICLKALKTLGF